MGEDEEDELDKYFGAQVDSGHHDERFVGAT
jgi:hypothetical protein